MNNRFCLTMGAARRLFPAWLLMVLGLAAAHAEAGTIHVPADFPTIEIAIAFANHGDEIVVAPGEYFEKLVLSKPLTIRSSGGPEVTTIDALGQFTHAITFNNGSDQGGGTLIEGFTIRNGEALGGKPNDRGGGIYIENSSPTIRNCVITECSAERGGGIATLGGSPVLENCTFLNNVATDSGGGAYFLSFPVTLRDCHFEGNEAQGSVAGGIHVTDGSCVITRCTFVNNSSVTEGGAIKIREGQLTVNDCWFEDNFSGDGGSNGRGGAIHCDGTTTNVTVSNSVFYNNSCTRFGGALYARRPIRARNCTFYGNATGSGREGVMGQFVGALDNCTAWNNGPTPLTSGTDVRYSNIEGGFTGVGNIGGDSTDEPLFADAANGDFRLLEGSPGIDAGNSALLPGTTFHVDFGGLPRAVNGLESGATGVPVFGYYVDMGAFEFQPAGGGPDLCPADTNGDGVIDINDLLNLLTAWGSCF